MNGVEISCTDCGYHIPVAVLQFAVLLHLEAGNMCQRTTVVCHLLQCYSGAK